MPRRPGHADRCEARVPEAWCNDNERCKKAAIPEDKRSFQSKTQLALEMLKIARQRGIQFGTVGTVGGYGKEPAFLRGVDGQGCRFVPTGHKSRMSIAIKPFICKTSSRRCPRGQVAADSQAIVNLNLPRNALIHGRPHSRPMPWQRLTLREGEKGLLVADYLHAPVWVWDGEEEQARCWHLLVRREVGAASISHYCLANAPLATPWQALARVQAQRFFIEHSFRGAKSECGIPTGHKWPTIKSAAGTLGIITWLW